MQIFSRQYFKNLSWEYVLLTAALIGFLLSLIVLSNRFIASNTVLVPSSGGTYIEGSVGEFQPLNPWFTVTNDVNRDIISLVFAGLLRYDPKTKSISAVF